MATRAMLVAWCLLIATAPAGQEIAVDRDVAVPMRDGVLLRADVFHPAGDGPYPVLVVRTPYGKHRKNVERFVKAGYIVVVQDARGRYASGGKYESFVRFETHDGEDGYDTVEWAARLPGSTGKVGTFGASYDAFLQWRLAPLQPPSLVAMAALSIPARYLDLEGPGTIRPGRRLRWWTGTISPDLHQRAGRTVPGTQAAASGADHDKWLRFLPWLELPFEVFAEETEPVRNWLRNPHTDPWKLHEGCREVTVPNLDIVGWYDHCNGNMLLYRTMAEQAATDVARNGSRLVIGPWSHVGRGNRSYGDIDFGAAAQIDTTKMQIRWFDYWLKRKANGVDTDPPVNIFVMGANRWRGEPAWPPARAEDFTLYLTSGGSANTPAGDGKLVDSVPPRAGTDAYRYDPRDPVPTLWTSSFFTIPADQRPLAARDDILVYQTQPLTQDMEVTGNAKLTLYASSSARDTDFFARLIDVAPGGVALDVAYGMVRARYRESLEKPKLLTPGEVTRFTIRLRPTSNVFRTGHRLRLDITSSDFPNYDRNHDTAADQNADPTLVTATQTVYHGGAHVSKLILPRVPSESTQR